MELQENKYIFSVLTKNHSGVLLRISGLFSRRCYNIISIVAAETEDPNITQIIIVVQGDDRIASQVVNQVSKLVDVLQVKILDPNEAVIREHVLVKVGGRVESIGELVNIANMFRANILDVTGNVLILELTGVPHILDSFLSLLKSYGIQKMIRTGCSAMERG